MERIKRKMKRKKIIIISIIINILLIGVFYSFINKDSLHHEKIIVKTINGRRIEQNKLTEVSSGDEVAFADMAFVIENAD